MKHVYVQHSRVGPWPPHKHFTRQERLAKDKHSGLLQKSVNYGHEKFYSLIVLAPVVLQGKTWGAFYQIHLFLTIRNVFCEQENFLLLKVVCEHLPWGRIFPVYMMAVKFCIKGQDFGKMFISLEIFSNKQKKKI